MRGKRFDLLCTNKCCLDFLAPTFVEVLHRLNQVIPLPTVRRTFDALETSQEPVDSIRKASQASPARGIVIHYFLTVSKHIGNRRVVDGRRKMSALAELHGCHLMAKALQSYELWKAVTDLREGAVSALQHARLKYFAACEALIVRCGAYSSPEAATSASSNFTHPPKADVRQPLIYTQPRSNADVAVCRRHVGLPQDADVS